MNLVAVWRFVCGACVLIHTSLCRETKTAEIMLKIYGATLQNSVGRATRRAGFLHPCATVSLAECNAVVVFPEYIPGISGFLGNAESTECILCVHTCLWVVKNKVSCFLRSLTFLYVFIAGIL